MDTIIYTALLSPLFGSIFAVLFGDREKCYMTGVVASLLLFVSFCASAFLLVQTLHGDVFYAKLADWIVVGELNIPYGFVVDHVSATMMVVVSLVSTCIHIYSIGYMSHDAGFNRFFSALSLFVFSMMVLVMSDNFAGLFIGWEGVGLCSYLLIGHWYHKDSASWAANEAFIMNRIADLGMLIGIFLIYWTFGSLQYTEVFAKVEGAQHSVLVLIAVLLFIGAMGKSAQFPLHTWLADAMEGPTPVSALIHAATMVTAGVYLVIRANELFALTPEVGFFIASLGAFVALFAASMALVNNDLKRIIAYSTLSQLGYMFVAAGLGAYWIALFHLVTHAFFKALLFLGAGNVMHAMHDELDIKKMGGLWKYMKPTAVLMVIASVALAGIYPFAGFFSKDKILEAAFTNGYLVLWFVLWVTAALTAFYSFRLLMLVFFTRERHHEHPHEAYKFMLIAMVPLAILAIIAGLFEGGFHHYVLQTLPDAHRIVDHTTEMILIALASFAAVSGILVAIIKYKSYEKDGGSKGFFYNLLFNQYYIPHMYDIFIVKPYMMLANVAWKYVDLKIVDATVDFIATTIYKSGEQLRPMQSGDLQKYLRWMAIGLSIIALTAVIFGMA